VDFLERLAGEGKVDPNSVVPLAKKVYDFLEEKRAGDVDIPEIQDIKRLIREAEAVSGIEVMGLTRDHARFLNLPFYQTGKVAKDPIGPADVAIVRKMLDDVKPEIIFVAGDLSDPHGTHRMCKEAIDGALTELRESGIGNRELELPRDALDARPVAAGGRSSPDSQFPIPEVWLYRGAWQEWPVTDATYLVPMSQEELRLKIQAIFKHQSQKDSAPFPGQDEREFWQRVEQRNKDTAATLDRLGLAEYFAMEAYVIA
jgi:glucosamine-6-phosphate deaminase